MKTTHTYYSLSTVLRTALALIIAISFTACDSNPVDPIEDISGMNPDSYRHKIPTVEVIYRVSSEKGVPSDIGLLMWVPEQGAMMFEQARVDDADYEYTFEITPDQLDQVQFMLNGVNQEAMLRAFIYVNREVEAYGMTSATTPMIALSTKNEEANKSCDVN